jgi:predicted restriction endonuclease
VTNPSQKIWSLVESRTTPEDELAKSHFLKTPKEAEEVPFEMFGGEDVRRTSERKVRTNQATFRFDVLARYGCECAVCSIDESVLIEAAHIVPKADNGSDDVRNGLPLCLLHHKATEKNVALIRIHPETLEVICTGGRSYEELRVTKSSLEELPKLPNKEALEYLWEATGAHLADE